MLNINQCNNIHFIGIGGIMMSAVAKYFLREGKKVSGYDQVHSDITDELIRMGVKINFDRQTEDIFSGVDLIIRTAAMPADHPALLRAEQLNIPVRTVYQALGELAKGKYTVAISGMHGKSTTTALIGLILAAAKLDPTVFVGTIIKEWNSNFRPAMKAAKRFAASYLISEACEYKDSFLAYHPDILVINNIESEHLDYFKNLKNIKKSFLKLISQIKPGGWLVVNGDDENMGEILKDITQKLETENCSSTSVPAESPARGLRRLGRSIAGVPCRETPAGLNIIQFGINHKADFQARDIKINRQGETEFGLEGDNCNCRPRGKKLKDIKDIKDIKFKLQIPGQFNVYNALAAISVASILGVNPSIMRKTLHNFTGVWRRFEFKGETNGIKIYDDYAHHPTEIKATLTAAKEKFKGKNWWLVFQPHLYSRTKDFLDDFAAALNLAPNLIIVEIYPAREENIYHISSRDLVDLINQKYKRKNPEGDPAKRDNCRRRRKAPSLINKNPALYFSSFREIEKYLTQKLNRGDIVMTMGAGEPYKIGDWLLKNLADLD